MRATWRTEAQGLPLHARSHYFSKTMVYEMVLREAERKREELMPIENSR